MQTILPVSPQEAVAAFLVDIQPAAPRDEDIEGVLPRVPEALKIGLPPGKFMDDPKLLKFVQVPSFFR